MAVLHLALLWGNTALPQLPWLYLSEWRSNNCLYAIPHGFTHASHTSTHASHAIYHAYLPRLLSRVPRKHGRDGGIVSAIMAMAWYFSPQGYFVLRFLFSVKLFLFSNSSNIMCYSMSNKTRWILKKILTLCDA